MDFENEVPLAGGTAWYIVAKNLHALLKLILPIVVFQISAEFAKVLLHLTESYSLPNFRSQRFNALVALAVTCPRPVSVFILCLMFHQH